MQQTIVAVFDSRAAAQQAQAELLTEGFSQDSIRLSEGSTDTTGTTGSTAGTTVSSTDSGNGGGIMGFFKDLFGSDEDSHAHLYSGAVTRGHCVLTVTASSDTQSDRASAILDKYDPLDIDEHASEWGGSTWAQQDTSRNAMGSQAQSQQYAQTQPASTSQGSYSGAQQGTQQGLADNQTRAIPVVQEEIQVGKREVQRGGVRVYSRVVETPVQESIGLREEHVNIERRPVDRAIDPSQANFVEGSFEVRETAEEPMVQKTARVVEEVVVGKEVTQRQQQVSDTVRRTEVQIDKLAGDQTQLSDADDMYYRTHWNNNYSTTGSTYDDYAPAYQFGTSMASNEHYRGRNWDEVEPNLRSNWELNHSGSTWENMKAAVRHGWDRMTS
jgi:uncharacterized protein (TIGR02271 family)